MSPESKGYKLFIDKSVKVSWSKVQYSITCLGITMHHSMVPCTEVQYVAVKFSVLQYSTVMYTKSITKLITVEDTCTNMYNTKQSNTVQYIKVHQIKVKTKQNS
jgi:hypothetical protein